LVAGNQSYLKRTEPSVELPPGTLPPPMKPRLTRRQWWYVNKWVILVPVIFVVVIVGLWAAETVPVVPNTQTFTLTAAPALIAHTASDYEWEYSLLMAHGGSVSGSYFAPSGDQVQFHAVLGSDNVSSTTSTGSFHLSTGSTVAAVLFVIFAGTPATIYVNGTISSTVPLI
jgi:hypothetical protein